MRVWTIQPAVLCERLKSKGVLLAHGRYADRLYTEPYRWMIGQMGDRLPSSKGRFPWWAWYRWREGKPDLRSGGHLPKGQKGVRLGLELDPGEVLLSDFAAWHDVLDNSFLSNTEAEYRQFHKATEKLGLKVNEPCPEPFRSQIRASWERIFDLTGGDSFSWAGKPSERDIQATFWELRLEDVRNVTFFTDRRTGF